jgi:hypothetical protein
VARHLITPGPSGFRFGRSGRARHQRTPSRRGAMVASAEPRPTRTCGEARSGLAPRRTGTRVDATRGLERASVRCRAQWPWPRRNRADAHLTDSFQRNDRLDRRQHPPDRRPRHHPNRMNRGRPQLAGPRAKNQRAVNPRPTAPDENVWVSSSRRLDGRSRIRNGVPPPRITGWTTSCSPQAPLARLGQDKLPALVMDIAVATDAPNGGPGCPTRAWAAIFTFRNSLNRGRSRAI